MPIIDPYTIFLHARSAVTAAHYPHRIAYTIAISGLDGSTPRTSHYRAIATPDESSVRVFSMSEEELAAPPPVPHGFNFNFTVGLCGGRCETGSALLKVPLGPPAQPFDILGVPLLSPTYTFGLAYSLPANRSEPAPATTSLQTIAIVSTKTHDYSVTLVDTPTVEGTDTYHLRLTPLRKPKDNRLRELWVGTQDYLPRKAIVGGNFTIAPLVDVPWTIDFTVRDGAPYVAVETAGSTLYLTHRRVVRNAAISFENVREPDGTIVHQPLIEPEQTETTLIEPF